MSLDYKYYKEFSLEGFGTADIDEVIDLLKAYRRSSLFWEIERPIKITFNQNLNQIFIVDDEYKEYSLNGSVLERWLTCEKCNYTYGFKEDMTDCIKEGHTIRMYTEMNNEDD